jgi:ADP-ribosyl-[dinitrogen reductase] hydrolase
MTDRNIYKDILLGVAVGDALGVPVEFKSREAIAENPVTEMTGFGTYNLAPGTFSDDSSLAFCLAEALTQEFNLQKIADNFVAWLNNNYWTARGNVFDVGIATKQSIRSLEGGCKPELAGGMDVSDNGNGSLMRILPLLVYIKDKPVADRYQITKQVSAITHGHIRSLIACFYYLEFARQIINGTGKMQVYKNLQTEIPEYLNSLSINTNEIKLFDRLLKENIYSLSEDAIFSSGYVLHTLEASIYCLLTTDNYKAAALKAVNLGADTDTTGAVTGGLAALLYGWETIPESWTEQIARKDNIIDLADRLGKFVSG